MNDATERLRRKAQNEQTCIALNDLLKTKDAEIAALRVEIDRLSRLAYIGEHQFDDLTYKARVDELRAELAQARQVPEGFVLVPVEPTTEMLDAARNAPMPMVMLDSISDRQRLEMRTAYRAMLAAAQQGAKSHE